MRKVSVETITNGRLVYNMIRMQYRLFLGVLFVAILLGIILYARGYRINIGQNELTSNGLVAVTSSPKSAKIFINNELRGVTDTTVYLHPGTYTFTIVKEGYFPWFKTATIQGEVVYSIDATLYPINSSLSPLTNIGVARAIRFGVAEQKALIFSKRSDPMTTITPLLEPTNSQTRKDGLFVFDPNNRAASFFSSLSSIAEYAILPPTLEPDNIRVIFSPNYDQVLLFMMPADSEAQVSQPELATQLEVPESYEAAYLLSLNEYNNTPLDVTASAATLVEAWSAKKALNLQAILSGYKKPLATFLKENTEILDITQDKNRIMYTATSSATLNPVLTSPLIGTNQTPEKRSVEPQNIYVYDVKEDKNYLLFSSSSESPLVANSLFFHPNAKNIIYAQNDFITLADFDGINPQKLYSGPFNNQFLAIANDGRLIVLTNLNPAQYSTGDLYAVGIR